ncbi:hypothetical protein K431DRAFT_303383 [Polychaeton citri CBS 116435]|uniref:Uncharacterized protein n=1 Tax=Polychaeton citri CBS 116435 TaxID=1314669 RepID=A0A9P4UMU1_9PEZI|nr:hypothetical protein K431DRAFT_303383 [Polychaeton citri CBS 116435]
MALRIRLSRTAFAVSLLLALVQYAYAIEERAAQNSVLFQNPVAAVHAQGTVTYKARQNIKLQWDSTRSPLNCDVYQGPDSTGAVTVVEVFRNIPNTTKEFPWFARNLANVTAGSPMHFSLYWAENSTCNHCFSNTTTFTLTVNEKESSTALPIGLGVGLGVGIPLIIAAAGLTWFFMRRQNRKSRAAQSTISSNSHQMYPQNPFESASSAGYNGYGPTSSFGDTSGSEAKTPLAEADGTAFVAELPPHDRPLEAGYQSPRAELMGDGLLGSPREKQ